MIHLGPIVGIFALIAIVVLLHRLLLRVFATATDFIKRAPAAVTESGVWMHTREARSRLSDRYPLFVRFLVARTTLLRFSGLPLTLALGATAYIAAVFGGLVGEVLEAGGIVRMDNFVNAFFLPWQVKPLTSAFLWITALGSGPAIVVTTIIGTGFLWSQRQFRMLAPLWIACAGAIGTTSVGKVLVGRPRPEFTIDTSAPFSSFPSGHATAAMAVYGFIAYAIARGLRNGRERFEVSYWTAVLIGFVGLSRIVLGVHYLTDVVGGFLVGGFWLLIGVTVAEWTQSAPVPKHPSMHIEELDAAQIRNEDA